jgi:tRNA threonylcarbamoyladenosine biosynthesis protein TsaE
LNGSGAAPGAKFSLVSNSDEETSRIGGSMGGALRGGDVLFVEGPLGAGKTCLIRGICHGLGFRGKVRSPSFALVCKYDCRPVIYHVDLYRISGESPELEDLSRQEYFSEDAVTLIEWGDKLEEWGVSPSARVNMTPDSDTRHIELLVYDSDLEDRLRRSGLFRSTPSAGASEDPPA